MKKGIEVRFGRAPARGIDKHVISYFGPTRGGNINLLNFLVLSNGRSLYNCNLTTMTETVEMG